ncbi:MAG: PD40 domain-containing protein [Paludibacteraceae bacterium]|nr:PD40 domain-containing protein [Paludibacteraceae bacterium]MBQ9705776.1 PD40 domain-containing protein [Paludibacteraceae bacterium]
MRKIVTLLAIAVLGLTTAAAQQLRVGKATMLSGTSEGGCYHAVFSPAGDYLLTSAENYDGLLKHDLKSGMKTRLSQARGAGYGVRISRDGKQITANRFEYRGNLRYTAIDRIQVRSGKTTVLRAPQREQVSPDAETAQLYVTTNGYEMTVHNGASETVIRPNGEESYFWCSVSPDGKHIMYVTARHGAQVCDINGNNPVFMGIMNAPQWIDSERVIAMRDEDNGDQVVKSSLVVRSISNPREVQTLVTGQKISMYPAVSADGRRIAFNNEKGQIFLMEVEQ